MLFDEVKKGNKKYFIQLNFGARSSKHISRGKTKGTLAITNHIDGTRQILTREQILDESLTNIGKAIAYGAFWQECS